MRKPHITFMLDVLARGMTFYPDYQRQQLNIQAPNEVWDDPEVMASLYKYKSEILKQFARGFSCFTDRISFAEKRALVKVPKRSLDLIVYSI